jgi:hypothetical protein
MKIAKKFNDNSSGYWGRSPMIAITIDKCDVCGFEGNVATFDNSGREYAIGGLCSDCLRKLGDEVAEYIEE